MDGDYEFDANALAEAGVQAIEQNPDVGKLVAQIGIGTLTAAGAEIGTLIPIPVIGTAIGAAIGAIVGFIVKTVGPLLASALHGQCTITIGDDRQDSDCSTYADNVREAARWVDANRVIAARMAPDQLYNQAHILGQDGAEWIDSLIAANNTDYLARIDRAGARAAIRKLPGASSILRSVQVPVATAIAASSPELIGLYRATLPTYFPALTIDDMRTIAAKVQPILDARVADAIAWANTLPIKPTYDQVKARYPAFVPNDVNRVVSSPLTPIQQNNADVATARAAIAAAGGVSIGATAPAGTNISGVATITGIKFVKNPDGTYAKDANGNFIVDHTATFQGAPVPTAPVAVTTNSSGHLVIPIAGTPSITAVQAAGVASAVAAGDPAAGAYAGATIAGGRAGDPVAIGNANLLSVADKIRGQTELVLKWCGPAAAAIIATGAHLAVPSNSPAARVSSLSPVTPVPGIPKLRTSTPVVSVMRLQTVGGAPRQRQAWLRAR